MNEKGTNSREEDRTRDRTRNGTGLSRSKRHARNARYRSRGLKRLKRLEPSLRARQEKFWIRRRSSNTHSKWTDDGCYPQIRRIFDAVWCTYDGSECGQEVGRSDA